VTARKYGFLATRRWIALGISIAALSILFVNLGFWQLRRWEERKVDNAVLAARMAAAPVSIEAAVAAAGEELGGLRFRPAVAVGRYEPASAVRVRSQVFRGLAGYHVLTPLVLADGRAVIVNRGWVTLETDPLSVQPAEGTVEVLGHIQLNQAPGPFGPYDPPSGILTEVVRVDLGRLALQMQWPLLPVYLTTIATDAALPQPVPLPDITAEGPHLSYAIQWFSFTAVALGGFFALVRKSGKGQTRNNRDTG